MSLGNVRACVWACVCVCVMTDYCSLWWLAIHMSVNMFVSKCLDLIKDICQWPLWLNSKGALSTTHHKLRPLICSELISCYHRFILIPFQNMPITACNTYCHCSSLMCYTFLDFLWRARHSGLCSHEELRKVNASRVHSLSAKATRHLVTHNSTYGHQRQ